MNYPLFILTITNVVLGFLNYIFGNYEVAMFSMFAVGLSFDELLNAMQPNK